MKREYKDNTKVFFSVNSKVNSDFEKYCDDNYMILKYDNGEPDVIGLKPEIIYTTSMEELIPLVGMGYKFKKDELL